MNKRFILFIAIFTIISSCNKESDYDSQLDDNSALNKVDGHELVDLGLSVSWATMNVGANSPYDNGSYFAWGESSPKTVYNWSTYKLCNGSSETITKYCNNSKYGVIDNLFTLALSDDAAYVNWGRHWRMPTIEELEELQSKCKWEFQTKNGVKGFQITGSNGNSIFLPAAGSRSEDKLYDEGRVVHYWSSSVGYSSPYNAIELSSYSLGEEYFRSSGRSVRPVTTYGANSIYSSLPVCLEIGNVSQIPLLHNVCFSFNVFCNITYSNDGKNLVIKGGNSEPIYIDLYSLSGYTSFHLGLSGLIVGDAVVCYDLACPNCYYNNNITKPLSFPQIEIAACSKCMRKYSLINNGKVIEGDAGRSLIRYRVRLTHNTLIVYDK